MSIAPPTVERQINTWINTLLKLRYNRYAQPMTIYDHWQHSGRAAKASVMWQ